MKNQTIAHTTGRLTKSLTTYYIGPKNWSLRTQISLHPQAFISMRFHIQYQTHVTVSYTSAF